MLFTTTKCPPRDLARSSAACQLMAEGVTLYAFPLKNLRSVKPLNWRGSDSIFSVKERGPDAHAEQPDTRAASNINGRRNLLPKIISWFDASFLMVCLKG